MKKKLWNPALFFYLEFTGWGEVLLFAVRWHLSAHIREDYVYLKRICWWQTDFPSALVTMVTRSYAFGCVLMGLFKISSFCERTSNNRETQMMHYERNKCYSMCYTPSHLLKYAQVTVFVPERARWTYSALIVIVTIKIHFHVATCIFYFWVSWLLTHLVVVFWPSPLVGLAYRLGKLCLYAQ